MDNIQDEYKKNVIGIDLGTSYSCVGIWLNDKVEIIVNDYGNRTTPSYVAFTQNERLIGECAKDQLLLDPQNVIFGVKRLIGRKFLDPLVQQDIKKRSFIVEAGPGDKPKIIVKFKGVSQSFYAEEISAMIINKLKQYSEAYLGMQIQQAVITVPAYFNDAQRTATKDAGKLAGLNILRIINEPTAAAIAYGLNHQSNIEQNVIIFDLGGGTLDVSLLNIDDGVFEMKAVSGDTYLGGEDFDNILLDYCVSEFMKKKGIDLKQNAKALRRIRIQCEKAKRNLSSSIQVTIEVDSLVDNEDFIMVLTRAKFESLCLPLFQKCITHIEKVIKDANIQKQQIDEIVMVGGSSRIPKIQQLIQEFFDGKKLNRTINPDEAVAYGATIQAAILTNKIQQCQQMMCIFDVIPLSLGVEINEGIMNKLILRNTTIPCYKKRLYTTTTDNQQEVQIKVYQGERFFTQDNYYLGQFILSGIQSAPKGVPQIEITFDINQDGLISISAVEINTKINNKIIINQDQNRLSQQDIIKQVNFYNSQNQEEIDIVKRISAKNKFESFIYQVKNKMEIIKLNDNQLINEINKLNQLISDEIKWLELNQNEQQEAYQYKLDQLKYTYQFFRLNIQNISSDQFNQLEIKEEEVKNVQQYLVEEVD